MRDSALKHRDVVRFHGLVLAGNELMRDSALKPERDFRSRMVAEPRWK